MKSSAVSSKFYLLVTSLVFLASTGSRCVGVLTRFILALGKWLDALLTVLLSICNDQGEPRGSQASRSSAPPKILPIETPAISLDELKRLTSNFGTKVLVGEGSYGRVFSATLSTGESALLSTVSRLKHEHFVELLGYCLEANNRILIYQYATKGSLHDFYMEGREYRGCTRPVLTGTNESRLLMARQKGSSIFMKRFQFDKSVPDLKISPSDSTKVLGTFGYHAPDWQQWQLCAFNMKQTFVELLGYCLEANNRILIYQYATKGSLHGILHGRKGVQGATPSPVLSWNQRVNLSHHFSHVKSLIHVECNLLTSLDEARTSCLRNVDGASILQEKENNVEESVDDLDGENSNGVMIIRNDNINLDYYPESNVVVNNPFSVLDEEETQETENNFSDNVPGEDIREEQDTHAM
ncbi:hypothetical protein IFM89_030647, partial [Coptis chinensis]